MYLFPTAAFHRSIASSWSPASSNSANCSDPTPVVVERFCDVVLAAELTANWKRNLGKCSQSLPSRSFSLRLASSMEGLATTRSSRVFSEWIYPAASWWKFLWTCWRRSKLQKVWLEIWSGVCQILQRSRDLVHVLLREYYTTSCGKVQDEDMYQIWHP